MLTLLCDLSVEKPIASRYPSIGWVHATSMLLAVHIVNPSLLESLYMVAVYVAPKSKSE